MYSPVCYAASNTMTNKTKSKQNKQTMKNTPAVFQAARALVGMAPLGYGLANATPAQRKAAYREAKGLVSDFSGPRPLANAGARVGGWSGNSGPGRAIGGFIGNIVGSGDYKTNFKRIGSNSLLTMAVPSFGGTSATIVHREYIQDVVTSSTPGAFTIQTFPLNPGINAAFPWLSVLAQNYEEYDINGMIFEFKSMSGQSVASTNTALGSVILTTQYDPTKPVFADKQEMENYDFSQSCKPSECVMHAVECKKSLSPVKNLYIRTGATTITGPDLRWSDFGNFSIATVGAPGASTNVGELWVSYSVTLRKPRLPSTGITVQYSAHAYTTGGSTGSPLGSVANYIQGPLGLSVLGGNVLSWIGIPGTIYTVNISANNGSPFTAAYAAGGFVNCAFKSLYTNDTSVGTGGIVAGAATIFTTITVVCTALSPNLPMSFSMAAAGTGNQWQTDIWVSALDGSITK